MASKEGQINLVVACEQERLLQWLLSGYPDVTKCFTSECEHHEPQECVDHLLAIYHGESDATDAQQNSVRKPEEA